MKYYAIAQGNHLFAIATKNPISNYIDFAQGYFFWEGKAYDVNGRDILNSLYVFGSFTVAEMPQVSETIKRILTE